MLKEEAYTKPLSGIQSGFSFSVLFFFKAWYGNMYCWSPRILYNQNSLYPEYLSPKVYFTHIFNTLDCCDKNP